RAEFVEVSAGRVTVSELSSAWLDSKRTRAKPAYMEDLETAWELHVEPVWGASRVGDITPDQVQEWISGLAQSRSASVVIRARGGARCSGLARSRAAGGVVVARFARAGRSGGAGAGRRAVRRARSVGRPGWRRPRRPAWYVVFRYRGNEIGFHFRSGPGPG